MNLDERGAGFERKEDMSDAPRTGLSRQIERSAINAIEAWCDQVASASLGDAEAFDTSSEQFRSSVARVNELRELEIELVEIDPAARP